MYIEHICGYDIGYMFDVILNDDMLVTFFIILKSQNMISKKQADCLYV